MFSLLILSLGSYDLVAQSVWNVSGSPSASGYTHRLESAFIEGGATARGFGIENPFHQGIQTTAWWGNLSYGMSMADNNLLDLTKQSTLKNTWTRPVILSGTYGLGFSTQSGRVTLGQNGIMTIGLDDIQIQSIANLDNNSNQFKLYVDNGIRTEELWIDLKSAWPDYVFDPGYELHDLSELESHILRVKHLPDVPTANQIEKEGLGLSEMTVLQQEKIEELYLYVIQLHKRLEKLESENEELRGNVEINLQHN